MLYMLCALLHLGGVARLTESISAVLQLWPQAPPPGHAHMTSGLAPHALARTFSMALVLYVCVSLGTMPASSRYSCTPRCSSVDAIQCSQGLATRNC